MTELKIDIFNSRFKSKIIIIFLEVFVLYSLEGKVSKHALNYYNNYSVVYSTSENNMSGFVETIDFEAIDLDKKYFTVEGYLYEEGNGILTYKCHVALEDIDTQSVYVLPTQMIEKNNTNIPFANCGFYSQTLSRKIPFADNRLEIVIIYENNDENIYYHTNVFVDNYEFFSIDKEETQGVNTNFNQSFDTSLIKVEVGDNIIVEGKIESVYSILLDSEIQVLLMDMENGDKYKLCTQVNVKNKEDKCETDIYVKAPIKNNDYEQGIVLTGKTYQLFLCVEKEDFVEYINMDKVINNGSVRETYGKNRIVSIDEINNKLSKEKTNLNFALDRITAENNYLNIDGWCYEKDIDEDENERYLILYDVKADIGYKIFTDRVKREDVYEVYGGKNSINSGYHAEFDLAYVNVDSIFKVYVGYSDSHGERVYETDSLIKGDMVW